MYGYGRTYPGPIPLKNSGEPYADVAMRMLIACGIACFGVNKVSI